MKLITKKLALPAGLGLLVGLAVLVVGRGDTQAQWPLVPQTNPTAQRNAMNLVLNQVKWLQNATRTAGSYAGGGYGMLMQQFQAVRNQYAGFTSTLTPGQSNVGANQLAELSAGLNIIQEAFTDYQTALANGQSEVTAFTNLRQVLNEAMGVWVQEFRRTCNQLRVGW
jgi:hypothetical protein